jgi:hypothetical protein
MAEAMLESTYWMHLCYALLAIILYQRHTSYPHCLHSEGSDRDLPCRLIPVSRLRAQTLTATDDSDSWQQKPPPATRFTYTQHDQRSARHLVLDLRSTCTSPPITAKQDREEENAGRIKYSLALSVDSCVFFEHGQVQPVSRHGDSSSTHTRSYTDRTPFFLLLSLSA